jgi:ribonuclease HI
VEITGETISFAPRKAIKSQVLADFVAEWVDTQLPTALIQPELWTMFFDGSLMKTGAGAGLLFISPLGKNLRCVMRLHFPASNNVAEYEALVNGLRIAIELGVRRLDARGDSQLVIDQVMKNSHCRRIFCILTLHRKQYHVCTLENFNVIFGPFARRHSLWRRGNTARRHRLWRRGRCCAGPNGRRGADVVPSLAP